MLTCLHMDFMRPSLPRVRSTWVKCARGIVPLLQQLAQVQDTIPAPRMVRTSTRARVYVCACKRVCLRA